MNITIWLGVGIGVVSLLVVIQTLRLRSAKRSLAAAKQLADNAWEAQELAATREKEGRALAEKYRARFEAVDALEQERVTKAEKAEAVADHKIKEVSDAAGNDDRTLDVLRDALDRKGDVPERPASDPPDRGPVPV